MPTTIVTGNVVDSVGTIWVGCKVTAYFVPTPNYSGMYSNNNGSPQPTFDPISAITDSAGDFTLNLADNLGIAPAETQWKFAFAPLASKVADVSIPITVTGANMDITALVQATIKDVYINPTNIQVAYADNEVAVQPGVGQLYYRSTDQTFRLWDGYSWLATPATGTVGSAQQYRLFYAPNPGTNPVASGSNLYTDATRNNLGVPGVQQNSPTLVSNTGIMPANQGNFEAINITQQDSGPGIYLGILGGWSTGNSTQYTYDSFTRGIKHGITFFNTKRSVGDAALIYGYINSANGGLQAQSDEGITGMTLEITEDSTYFHGTVAATTGSGDIKPQLAFTSGDQHFTDGAFLLNMSKNVIAGNLNGGPGPIAGTYLGSLPVIGVTLPLTTAWGAILNPLTQPESKTSDLALGTTLLIQLQAIGGVFKPFVAGSLCWICGAWYPEQTFIQTAGPVSNLNQQEISFTCRYPNPQGSILMQGGLAGYYISFDANLAATGMRSSYYAFGSLTGTDLVFGSNVRGSVEINTTTIIPRPGWEAAQYSGAGSGFHLYQGAEIVISPITNQFTPTLEQNGVPWGVGDLVENPHYPILGGNGIGLDKTQYSPSSGGINGIAINIDGPGWAQNSFTGVQNTGLYIGNGFSVNPMPAGMGLPDAVTIQGIWNDTFTIVGPGPGGIVFKIGPSQPGVVDWCLFSFPGGGTVNFLGSRNQLQIVVDCAMGNTSANSITVTNAVVMGTWQLTNTYLQGSTTNFDTSIRLPITDPNTGVTTIYWVKASSVAA
jgi:hypothetical protein